MLCLFLKPFEESLLEVFLNGVCDIDGLDRLGFLFSVDLMIVSLLSFIVGDSERGPRRHTYFNIILR